MARSLALPAWDVRWALFLDVDGTLLEIVPRPDEVRVTVRLRRLLDAASRQREGWIDTQYRLEPGERAGDAGTRRVGERRVSGAHAIFEEQAGGESRSCSA